MPLRIGGGGPTRPGGGVKRRMEALMGGSNVTLVKKDGTIARTGVPAIVTPGQVTTFTPDLPVEVGDHILRPLPNGLQEDYVVVDPRFYDVGGMDAHFQIKVRRSEQPASSEQSIVQNITNNFNGANSRVNINSTDKSSNVSIEVGTLQLASFLEQLKPALGGLPEAQRTEIAKPLALLEDEVRSGKPDQSRVRSALSSMKTIAEGAAGNLVASGIIGMIENML